jgi:lambda repressor-like predicted transcriptional regulator
MPNDRLRTAMLERGITPAQLAAELQVDPKSVERWIKGRTPYRRHRYAVAAQLGADETYLWPDALSPDQVANASESEIINVYPHRWTVPSSCGATSSTTPSRRSASWSIVACSWPRMPASCGCSEEGRGRGEGSDLAR